MRTTPALVQQGWRAAGLGPRDRLEAVWEELGHAHSSSSRSRGVAADDTTPAGARP